MKSVALNGFGRIGKNFLHAYLQDARAQRIFSLAAINIGSADKSTIPYMIIHDSILPLYDKPVRIEGDFLIIQNMKIRIVQETDAKNVPWKDLYIDYVVDATGKYTHADDARKHITQGAKKVIITAPAYNGDITLVMGVNHHLYNKDTHTVISLGSCTTNAVVPFVHVVKKHAGIHAIIASSVHAYTNTQMLLDGNPVEDDLRKSRAADLNIIPTKTGAARSVVEIFPEYKDILVANALRIPLSIVSLAEVTFLVDRTVSENMIHEWFEAEKSLSSMDVLTCTDEYLVSGDFKGNKHSVVLDKTMTMVTGSLIRLYGWYDNEWAYSNRIKDFLIYIC